MTTTSPAPTTKVGKAAEWADERLGLAAMGKKNLRKIFPDHWSFMLGEIALWSFVVLLLSGVFLTLWFQPSMAEITYQLLRAAPRRQHVAGVRVVAADQLRRPRRSADAPDAPLVGDALHRRDDDPPAAGRLHRRLPQAA